MITKQHLGTTHKLVSSSEPAKGKLLMLIHKSNVSRPKRPRIAKVLTEHEVWRMNLERQFREFKQNQN